MSIEHLTEQNFLDNTKNGLVLVDFFATWCGPCRMQAPILERVVVDLDDSAKIYKVDVDECEGVAKQYGIMSIPTLVLLKDGKEVARNVGLMSQDAVLELIQSHK